MGISPAIEWIGTEPNSALEWALGSKSFQFIQLLAKLGILVLHRRKSSRRVLDFFLLLWHATYVDDWALGRHYFPKEKSRMTEAKSLHALS
jgi:hypothetical protein